MEAKVVIIYLKSIQEHIPGNKRILFVFANFTLLCFVTMATTFNPCFHVVLLVSSVGFAFALKLHFLGFFKFLLWVVFVDCIGVGLIIASLCW